LVVKIADNFDAANPAAIDCIDFLPLVDDLLEIDNEGWDAQVVRHLEECPPCRIFLEQLQDLRRILRAQDDEALPLYDPRIRMLLTQACSTREDDPS
jgi:predicted anti-sigma-YlaC factor YlaD